MLKTLSLLQNVEKSAKHGIHCLPCSGTNGVVYQLPQQPSVHIEDIIETSFYQGTKHNSWLFHSCYSNISMASSHLNSRIAWHTVYAILLSNYK